MSARESDRESTSSRAQRTAFTLSAAAHVTLSLFPPFSLSLSPSPFLPPLTRLACCSRGAGAAAAGRASDDPDSGREKERRASGHETLKQQFPALISLVIRAIHLAKGAATLGLIRRTWDSRGETGVSCSGLESRSDRVEQRSRVGERRMTLAINWHRIKGKSEDIDRLASFSFREKMEQTLRSSSLTRALAFDRWKGFSCPTLFARVKG